jgi:hypothetical protein
MGTPCPVCDEVFRSYLDLARHMVRKDRPTGGRPKGAHILYLEMILDRPYVDFGWGKDKKIAIALADYHRQHRSWPR